MGAGEYMSVTNEHNPLDRVPHAKPPFTISDLKKAIPPHCFNRSLARSFAYVLYDLTITAVLYHIATTYFHHLPTPLSSLAWASYWVAQGCVLTGVWVIAHECGHHAFSDYQWVDDTVGFILHSSLLVPYFSWKYSHHRHHSNTGSLERDEVFVPKSRSKVPWYSKYFNNTLGRILMLITYLQHTHPGLPHYDSSEWEWLKGALATVDRDYGVLNKVFHHITDTHVVHHLFSTMPHYNAMEARKALKPVLGEYYRFDETPFYVAMWREMKECLFVEPDEGKGGVFWYKNKMN
ncbi:hypothetical protein M8C21_017691 [Ambrosia artemisiifolia]|uniref:Uncharacterized protein n=1 Tax=Ambrosia artemisiifolia TaxID=4212 RepID=A0AAD5CTG0_AMBAR|nr:hypothetical protein M8C21_017691 [Ambrosia artemisiifolia]